MTWSTVPFSEALRDASSGNTKIPKSEYRESGSVAVVDQGQKLVAGYVDDVSAAQKAALPVIVFGDHTRAFKFADFPFAMGADGVKVLAAREGFDPKYLYWYLSSLDIPSAGYARHYKFLKECEVPKPSLAEQKRIAAALDQVDALRAKRHEAMGLLDDLAQSLFLDSFGKGWGGDRVRLGDCLDFITSGGRGWAKYYSDSGARFIRSLDVRMNEVTLDRAVCVTPPDNAEARRTRVRKGDVLLTITGSLIGRAAAVPDAAEGSYVSQHVAILRPSAERLKPGFLARFLSLPSEGQWQIAKAQYGQTKPGLNFEQIAHFTIPLPEVSEQEHFLRRMAALDEARARHRAHLVLLGELFTSVRQRAFAGRLWEHETA